MSRRVSRPKDLNLQRICPTCLARYPADQVRCADPKHLDPLQRLDATDDPLGLVGSLVDERYIVLSLLGEGAMGSVYRAWQRTFSREVALKVVDLAHAGPHDRVELGARFLREVSLLARVDSPLVARILDSAVLPDGNLYYAMERVRGTSLDRVLLTDGRLPAARVLSLAPSLCSALAAVHKAGLVHRDVKPGNLMLTRSPDGSEVLKLVDFGIARPVDEPRLNALTAEFAILGSFPYMAPEQLVGKRDQPLGPGIDVYGAGCTLFEMAVGHPPFPGPTAPAWVQQHSSAPIPRLDAFLDPEPAVLTLDTLIQRCLAKDPAARPADGAALLAELDRLGASRRAVPPAPSAASPVLVLSGARDPAALPGIQAHDVLSRVEQRPERAPLVTPGRIALSLAVVTGVADVVFALVAR